MQNASQLADSISLAADVLRLSVLLSVEKDSFGELEPTAEQLGWSYGFSDGFAQSVGLSDDEEFILFISMTFERVFGNNGLRYFRSIAFDQNPYLD